MSSISIWYTISILINIILGLCLTAITAHNQKLKEENQTLKTEVLHWQVTLSTHI